MDTGLPVIIRAVPGLVRGVATFVGSLTEIDTTRTPLVLDWGFISKKNETILTEAKILFVLLQRHNGHPVCDADPHLADHFFYYKRLIHAGKREVDGMMLYLYGDADMVVEEQKMFYQLPEGRSTEGG